MLPCSSRHPHMSQSFFPLRRLGDRCSALPVNRLVMSWDCQTRVPLSYERPPNDSMRLHKLSSRVGMQFSYLHRCLVIPCRRYWVRPMRHTLVWNSETSSFMAGFSPTSSYDQLLVLSNLKILIVGDQIPPFHHRATIFGSDVRLAERLLTDIRVVEIWGGIACMLRVSKHIKLRYKLL